MTLAWTEKCDPGFGLTRLTRLTRSTLINGTLVGFAQFGSPDDMSRRSRSPSIKSDDTNTLGVHISRRSMAFRLPAQFESPLSPPMEQHMSFTNTWRGVLILEGMAMGDGELHHELYVTTAETSGESRFELWPPAFSVKIIAGDAILQDVNAWVHTTQPTMATFMPDRLLDAAQHARNKALFRTFSDLLNEHQIIAVMPWNAPERIPGAGAILIPSPSKLIVNVAVLLVSPFPDFVAAPQLITTHLPGISPYTLQDSQYTRFQQSSSQAPPSTFSRAYGS